MIKLNNVKKSFNRHKSNEIKAINNTSVTLEDVGLVTFLGNSGCGKTTLLNAIGGLDNVDKGDIYIDNDRITRRSSGKRDEIRNLNIGYIFQNYNLIEDATVFDNVALALRMIGFTDKKAIERRVMYVLDAVGIARYRNRPAKMLSGGERQRVGIARAIVKNPKIIIADEPTGNLDSANTIEVMNIIKSIAREKLVILVTHEREIAEFYADRIIEIVDGSIVGDRENEHEGNLDYRIDNNVYLKDMPYSKDLSKDGFDVRLYSDSPVTPPRINVIIRDGNLFIDTGGQFSLGSDAVQIIDGSYEGLSKDVYEKYEFEYGDYFQNAEKIDGTGGKGMPRRLRYRSTYGFFRSIRGGFTKVNSYSKIKKILLVGFILASMIVLYAISNVAGISHITDDLFTTTNQNYLTASIGQLNLSKYNELSQIEGINYVLLGEGKVTFKLRTDDYTQSFGYNAEFEGALTDYNQLSSEELIIGSLPSNEHEMVIDKQVAKTLLNNAYARAVGLTEYEDLIGREVTVQYFLDDFTIVGISDNLAPCIYVDKSLFTTLSLYNPSFNSFSESTPLETDSIQQWSIFEKTGNITITRGEAPDEDYECLVPDSLVNELAVGTAINVKVNGENLVVSGFYHDTWGGEALFVNDNTYLIKRLPEFTSVTFSPEDKEEAMVTLQQRLNTSIQDNYENDRAAYQYSVADSIRSTIAVAIVMVIISLIEIYLMLRASFLSRIKEVGVLRAIGVKKSDIYRMFSGEVFAITILTAIPGMAVMGYILYYIISLDVISGMYRLTPLIVIGSFLLVFLFNMLAGLLPVFTTMRKTPAAILARNDVQ